MSTIPCDFCPHPVDRAQMEEIEISHYVPDSSGDDLAYARTYFFGHPDCVRKFYRGLVDHKLDLFKHIPTGPNPNPGAPPTTTEGGRKRRSRQLPPRPGRLTRAERGSADGLSEQSEMSPAPVAQLDSASPSE